MVGSRWCSFGRRSYAQGDFYDAGLEIRELLRRAGIPLIINDRIDIALALDADGVHIGTSDMPIVAARKILGPNKIIGLSVNHVDELDDPGASFADYLAVSPVFATQTKKDTAPAWGLSGLETARGRTNKPLVAIGGISHTNAESVIAAGADCIAVVTAIVAADDPAEATKTLKAIVKKKKIEEEPYHTEGHVSARQAVGQRIARVFRRAA